MTRFLKDHRYHDLVAALIANDVPEDIAKKLAGVEYDMHEVDLAMGSHAQCIDHFRRMNRPKDQQTGILCLTTLMLEANDRGYGEKDFPIALAIIKGFLNKNNTKTNTTIQ